MRALLLAIVLTTVCLPALAIGRVTTDPNAPGAAAPKVDQTINNDARLEQKVTLTETRKCVSAILDDLTKSTGVVFKAGYNNNDWQVRDRKMCVFAKDVPLAQVMNSISHVMKFKWERKGDAGACTYRLYMDRRTLLDADSQKLREDERLRAKAEQKRKEALDDFSTIDSLSPGELAALKIKDPLTYVFATTGVAGAMGQMFREAPTLSEAMAAGREMTMTGADMSELGRAGVSRLIGSIAKTAKLMNVQVGGAFDNIDPANVTISLNHDLQRQAAGLPQYVVLAMFNIQFSEHATANFPLMNPDSAVGHVLGNGLIRCIEGQVSTDDLNKSMQPEIEKASLQDMQAMKSDYGEPEIQHPAADDSTVQTKIKLKPDGTRLADIQKALAEASSYAVISDSFGKTETASSLSSFLKDENELSAVLKKLCDSAFYNWDKQAAVLEFRDREWFRKRSAQIPEATLEGWRQTFTKTGTLDIGDLAQIARLDTEQFSMNVAEDEVLGNGELNNVIWMQRDLLRLYDVLTDAQRSAAFSDAGFDLQNLSDEQYAVAQEMLKTRNPKFLSKPDASITLSITRKQQDKQSHYAFTVATTDDVPPIKGEFTTPKYQEPKAAKPAKPAGR